MPAHLEVPHPGRSEERTTRDGVDGCESRTLLPHLGGEIPSYSMAPMARDGTGTTPLTTIPICIIRMHVLESAGDDPLGPYAYKGQLATDPKNEFYAIDGSILRKGNGDLYFLWAGHPGHRFHLQARQSLDHRGSRV